MLDQNSNYELVAMNYPMFAANIKRRWGSKEFVTYIKELVYDAKTGTKSGFPEKIFNALVSLSVEHDQEYPDFLPHLSGNADFNVINSAFPRVGERINYFWGRVELFAYIDDLRHEARGRNRQGFPFEILLALNKLAELHHNDYGHLLPADDLWLNVGQ